MKAYTRRNIVGGLLGVAFVSIGTQHFAQPELFNAIVPDYLGWPSFWNYTSGAMEILFGLGLLIPKTRKYAAQLLVATRVVYVTGEPQHVDQRYTFQRNTVEYHWTYCSMDN